MGANQSFGLGTAIGTAWSGGHRIESTLSASWVGIWQTDQLAPPITHLPIACRLDSGVSGASGPGGPGGNTGLGAGDGVAVGVGDGAGVLIGTGCGGPGSGSRGGQMPAGQTTGGGGAAAASPVAGTTPAKATAPMNAASTRLATRMGVLLEAGQLSREVERRRRFLAQLGHRPGARGRAAQLPVAADPFQVER